jgi:hypothetical protein
MSEPIISRWELERRAFYAIQRGETDCPYPPHTDAAAAWQKAIERRIDWKTLAEWTQSQAGITSR